MYTNKSNLYIAYLFFVWFLFPFFSIFLVLFFISQVQLHIRQYNFLFFLMSMSFALLAYTQVSLAAMDTDIVRYYNSYQFMVGSSFSLNSYLIFEDVLTYSFMFVNILLVYFFKNVQIISLFWTFFIYMLFFLTVLKLFSIEGIRCTKENLFWVCFISLFGLILFTQVTETIKNAAAFALFFYLFACFLAKENLMKIFILYFIGVGIHSSILMLFPLFFYKLINSKLLFCFFLISIFLSSLNLTEILMELLPDVGYLGLILKRVEHYALEGENLFSIRYVLILFFVFCTALLLLKRKVFNEENKFLNIVLLYLIIATLNYSNFDGFVRFVNFIQFIVVFVFIPFLRDKKRNQSIIAIFFIVFLVTNLQMTYSRTISPHLDYRSCYMDNSLSKILFSNVVDYLTFKAY